MKKSDIFLLILLGLIVTAAAAYFVRVPGYMDAEYYLSGGIRLAEGHGLTEPFLWNYLDSPSGLPHPSYMYWMPLASLLSAAGMILSGNHHFFAARIPFLLLAASLPALTGWLAYSLTSNRAQALLAGCLAAFSGFYLPYLVTTDTFPLYMLLGAALITWALPPSNSSLLNLPVILRYTILGLLAGLMHLSRADGVIWLGAVGLLWLLQAIQLKKQGAAWLRTSIDTLLGVVFGYSLVTGFWYVRNVQEFGSLFPPGNSRALWLQDYDQMFSFTPEQLTPQTYLAAGWPALLQARWMALWQNLQTWIGVQGQIILLPLALAGFWSLRRERRIQLAAGMWLLILLVMTLVFPLAGARGGFFHSGAAFQLFFWVGAAAGFDAFLKWGVLRRGWKTERSWKMFAPALVCVMLVYSGGLYLNRVIGPDSAHFLWQAGWDDYRAAEAALVQLGANPLQSVAVNNPPGYYAVTGRAAVVIPDGNVSTLVQASQHYGVDFVLLEANHVRGLESRYRQPVSGSNLEYLKTVGEIHIFRVIYPT